MASCRISFRLVSPRCPRSDQAMSDAGFMHLDAEEVSAGRLGGLLYEGIAVAEADLDGPGRSAPEEHVEVERLFIVFHTVDWPQFVERLLLRGRDAPGTADEGSNRAFFPFGINRESGPGSFSRAHRPPMSL